MKLLTRELSRKLPPLYSGTKLALIKFFTPDSNWYWYVTEGSAILAGGKEIPAVGLLIGDAVDGVEVEDILFFGLVDGHDREWGYFRLSELSRARGRYGLPIERDLWYTPTEVK